MLYLTQIGGSLGTALLNTIYTTALANYLTTHAPARGPAHAAEPGHRRPRRHRMRPVVLASAVALLATAALFGASACGRGRPGSPTEPARCARPAGSATAPRR